MFLCCLKINDKAKKVSYTLEWVDCVVCKVGMSTIKNIAKCFVRLFLTFTKHFSTHRMARIPKRQHLSQISGNTSLYDYHYMSSDLFPQLMQLSRDTSECTLVYI